MRGSNAPPASTSATPTSALIAPAQVRLPPQTVRHDDGLLANEKAISLPDTADACGADAYRRSGKKSNRRPKTLQKQQLLRGKEKASKLRLANMLNAQAKKEDERQNLKEALALSKRAEEIYRSILKKYPDSEAAKEAKRALDEK